MAEAGVCAFAQHVHGSAPLGHWQNSMHKPRPSLWHTLFFENSPQVRSPHPEGGSHQSAMLSSPSKGVQPPPTTLVWWIEKVHQPSSHCATCPCMEAWLRSQQPTVLVAHLVHQHVCPFIVLPSRQTSGLHFLSGMHDSRVRERGRGNEPRSGAWQRRRCCPCAAPVHLLRQFFGLL